MFLKRGWLISALLGALMVVGNVGAGSAAEFACTSGDVACLISSIETANANGVPNTIQLEAGTYEATEVHNDTEGPNAFPSITGILTIRGREANETILGRNIVDPTPSPPPTPVFRVLHVAAGADLTLEHLTISGGNLSEDFPRGGGILNRGTLTLDHSSVRNNGARDFFDQDQEGIGIWNAGKLTLEHSTVARNIVGFFPGAGKVTGGGIWNSGDLILHQSAVIGNSPAFRGQAAGIFNEGSLEITHSRVEKNGFSPAFPGGNCAGILNLNQAKIEHTTINGNAAGGNTGGICNHGAMTVSESAIIFNGLNGIANSKLLTITNSTIAFHSDFTAEGACPLGAIHNSGDLTITNSTIADNTRFAPAGSNPHCPQSPGLNNVEDGRVHLQNSILARNSFITGEPWDCSGPITSLGHNLIGTTYECGITLQASDLTGDPELGAFTNDSTAGNGHYPLLEDSQAVDAGNNTVCPPTDQLGQIRPADGDQNGTEDCDIGAVEFQPPNQAPIVDAGPAQTVTLPNMATLNGTVTDDGLPNPPGTVTTTWSKVIGLGTVTFGNAAAVDTTASFSEGGPYVLRLTANDSARSVSADVSITVTPPNQIPTVDAGPNQTITLPNGATLNGTVTDDGWPDPPGTVTTTWTKSSGLGTVTFANANAVDTTATFSLPGTYILRLTANDGAQPNSDTVFIVVNPVPVINQPPTVNAGPAQTITLPNTATLNGTVSDDGLPDPPGIVATTWAKVSGSGTVTFGNASAVDTTATFSEAGTYVLRLTATDGALMNSAEVTITVNPPWVETVPDIRGLWTEGPVSGFATACQNPADNGPFNDPGGETYRITNQTGASFSVNKVETVVDGGDTVVQVTTCAGTVAANGTVTASCTYNVSLNGTFWYNGTSTLTGSLRGNALTYTLAGQDQVGDTCQWTQAGTDTRSGPVPPPVPINRWIIAGIGDLDGNSTADILWRDTTTGAVAAWFMNGLDVSSSAVLATNLPAAWVIGGVGDLDDNGTADVLWHHPSSGTVAAWYMTLGTGAVERGEVLATGLPADWIITGMGDLDGNGAVDVVWRHVPSGLVAAWYMTPGTGAIDRSAVLATIPPDWVIGGVGDLDNNGTADVLWRHPTSGTVAAWYMTPVTGAVGPSKVLASGLPGDWLIGDIGDLDANGTADVIWRHVPSGLVAAWLMTPGTGEVGTSDVISTIPPDWMIAGMGDLNLGNGPADVVWHHPSSGLAAGWLMNGLTVDDSGVIDAP